MDAQSPLYLLVYAQEGRCLRYVARQAIQLHPDLSDLATITAAGGEVCG
jgi:hypothetical protein